jgi:hypothetical protein
MKANDILYQMNETAKTLKGTKVVENAAKQRKTVWNGLTHNISVIRMNGGRY